MGGVEDCWVVVLVEVIGKIVGVWIERTGDGEVCGGLSVFGALWLWARGQAGRVVVGLWSCFVGHCGFAVS